MALEQRGVLPLEHPHGGGRGKQGVYAELLHQLPQDGAIGAYRRALVQHRGLPADQGAIDNIGMADHPADVAGAEKRIARAAVEQVLHGRGQRYRIAARVALHALGLAGGAGRIKDVAGLGRLQPLHRHPGATVARAQGGVIQVASGHGFEWRQAPVKHHHRRGRRFRQAQGLVQQRLVRHHLAAARAAVGAHHDLGRGVVDALGQVDGCKPAEHHRMHRADPGAGQHREHGFRHHRHVQQHAVAPPYAQFLEHRGGRVDLFVYVLPGVRPLLLHFGGHPDQRGLIALGRQPPVDRVVAKIGRSAHEPLGEWRPRKIQYRLKRRIPMDASRLLPPESIPVMQ
ncbi:hypothetical protein D3C86_1066660 [compost metagenome]